MSVGERPLGVTILSILGFIVSGLVLLGGLAVTVFGVAFLPAVCRINSLSRSERGRKSLLGRYDLMKRTFLPISFEKLSRKGVSKSPDANLNISFSPGNVTISCRRRDPLGGNGRRLQA